MSLRMDQVKWEIAHGNYLRAVTHFFNSLPELLYPGSYDETQDHNLKSPIFYWRELFHVTGGLCLAIALRLFTPRLVVLAVIFTLAAAKEYFLDVPEQPNGIDFKNIVDTLAWTLGAFIYG